MSGSCHLDRASASNGVECQIFVIDIVFDSRAHSRNYKGGLTQKKSFLVISSNLYDFQICFSCWPKKSKQTFKIEFVI